MKCESCKNEINENSKYCEYCGSKTEKHFKPIFREPKSKTSTSNKFSPNLSHTSTTNIPEQNVPATKKEKTQKELQNEKNIEKRLYVWKEKLIDLSKRNRLLNFKFSKTSTLRIIDEQPPEIYRYLVQNLQTMEFLPIKENESNIPEEEKKSAEELNEDIEFNAQEFEKYETETLNKKHSDKYLQTKLPVQELNKVLGKISSTAKATNDDLGYNVLFLTVGSIVWYENDKNTDKMEAPVILIPVEIKRKGIGQPYTIKYNEDSVILNPALTLKFKRDFNINFEDIVLDEEETNPVDIFVKVKDKIKSKNNWKLLNNIYIGLFSFAKFVMYKDLDEYSDIIKENKLIETICGLNEEKQIPTEKICPMKELDDIVKPQTTYQILDADSSQQQAIQVVKAGNNLIIEGPPGTGKSQTIANMIAELLAQNKKVLFVSQKIAALEVVKSRLEANGLSPYCLELHSNKTNKKNVLAELIKTLEYDFKSTFNTENLDKLSIDINSLKKYSNELHSPAGTLEYCPYDALGIVLKNNNIPDFRYIFNDYDKWTKEDLINKKDLFNNTADIVNKIGNPTEFAWFGATIKEIDFEQKIKLQNEIDKIVKDITDIEQKSKELAKEVLLKQISKLTDLSNLTNTADIVLNIPVSALEYIDNNKDFETTIKDINNNIKQFNLYNDRVKDKYSLNILKQDIENIISQISDYKDSFISKLFFKFYKEYKFIKQFFINKHKPNLTELLNDLNNLKELNTTINKINDCNDTAYKLYGDIWKKTESCQEDIQKQSDYLLHFKEMLEDKDFFTDDIAQKIKNKEIKHELIKHLITDTEHTKDKIKKEIETVTDILKFDWNEAFSCEYDNIDLNILKNKFISISQKAEDLTLWFKYLNNTDKIKENNLIEFWNICRQSQMETKDYGCALETQFLRDWLNGFVLKNNDTLKGFNSLEQNDLVKDFVYLDKKQITSAKERLLAKLAVNANKAKDIYLKETSELRRQGKLQRIRKSLRQIIRSIPNLFMDLKPCLMMSPTTVAQLLDPNIFHFDVVIFDEASQLTTEDCIGSIIRGTNLVVAGDTKQLPPTSFFKTVVEADEEEYNDDEEKQIDEYERTDLDSILDECTTSGFPQCMLRWHYRSKHEHLIAFSNKHLYENLYTFPNCTEKSDTLGIKFLYHQPSDTTKEEKCLEEAKIVAKAVMEHAKKYPNMSLGVATLNIKQKSLIENEIEKLREEDSSCEEFFNDNKQEYFFVKNLESIQGDERDIIMISVGYFKNKNGILPMNFGPINKDGGERRLNVLITRARYMIKIFSAIKAADFNLEKTNSKGVHLLKSYLDFAEKGEDSFESATDMINKDKFVSPFEESVCSALRQKGYRVTTQVGCSNYKIDLAIKDKTNSEKFLLGIESDGLSYNSCATVRDRDRLRKEVLERLGWKMYRVWSTDWFKSPKEQLEKLTNYIENIGH